MLRSLPMRGGPGHRRWGGEPARDLGNRDHEVDDAGSHGAAGHVGVAWGGAIGALRQGQPAGLLDRLHPEGTFAAAARQQDADGILPGVLGERGHQDIDRLALAPGIGVMLPKLQRAVLDREHRIERQHIGMVRLDPLVVGGGQDGNGGMGAENGGQGAFAAGAEMCHRDEGDAAVGRYGLEEVLQRLNATGGCADAGDRKMRGLGHSGTPCQIHGPCLNYAIGHASKRLRSGSPAQIAVAQWVPDDRCLPTFERLILHRRRKPWVSSEDIAGPGTRLARMATPAMIT